MEGIKMFSGDDLKNMNYEQMGTLQAVVVVVAGRQAGRQTEEHTTYDADDQ